MSSEIDLKIVFSDVLRGFTVIKSEQLANGIAYIKHLNIFTTKKSLKKLDKVYEIEESSIKKFKINDHINKTGENPLRKTKPLEFLDICNLYTKEKQGIITTCLGKKYNKEKKHHPYPSTFISSIAILCKKINPKVKIKGILLNSV